MKRARASDSPTSSAHEAGLKAGPETVLLPTALAAFSAPDVETLARQLYLSATKGEGPDEAEAAASLIPVLFELAAVSQQIIIDNAAALGEMTGGMARLLGIEGEEVEVVVAGSLFERAGYPLYYDAFLTALHRAVPRAWAHRPRLSPAVGAYLLGLEAGGVAITREVLHRAAAIAPPAAAAG